MPVVAVGLRVARHLEGEQAATRGARGVTEQARDLPGGRVAGTTGEAVAGAAAIHAPELLRVGTGGLELAAVRPPLLRVGVGGEQRCASADQ